jgi:vancomycin aglycone glucosyltransferase
VLIATTGSLGDLNPMLAIGERLLAMGAEVDFATYPCYQRLCVESGFRFFPLGGSDEYVGTLKYSRQMLDEQSFDTFVDRVNFDQLDQLFAQLLEAAEGADVLVAPSHVAPAHLVAEKKGIPYVACAMCLIHIKSTAPIGTEAHRRLATSAARWHSALRKLRAEQRLERRVLPFASLVSDATKMLGVLPSFLLSPADLRTPRLEVTGYAEHRQTAWMTPDDELRDFCDPRTVAFSFGSFADACDPDYFLEESVAACRALGLKCVYLTQHATERMRQGASDDVLIRSNLAPAAVFPLVGIAVHHGGTGTLMAACKHSKPMVIVPFFLDQPQQAARMEALIGAPTVQARNYERVAASRALQIAMSDQESMSQRVRALMAKEIDGAESSARSIFAMLGRTGAPLS